MAASGEPQFSITLLLFEKVGLLSICLCPVAVRNGTQGTEHGDVFFCSAL
jgi:hypothetical protein